MPIRGQKTFGPICWPERSSLYKQGAAGALFVWGERRRVACDFLAVEWMVNGVGLRS
jgi:hypothetical protein